MSTALHLLTALDPGWIVSVVVAVVGYAATRTLGAIQKSHASEQRKSLEAAGVKAVQALLQAEAVATGGKLPTAADLPRLKGIAVQVARAHAGELASDAEAWLANLIHVELATQTANHASLAVTAPGGGVVNLPTPVKTGFASLGALAALCFAAAVALLASLALAAPSAPPAAPSPGATVTGAAILPLPSIDWRHVALYHGPSAQAFVVDPKSPHPVELPAGLGYGVGAGFGQLTLNGAHVSLVNLSVEAFLSIVTSPSGAPAGGVQFAPVLGFLSNAVGAGPLLTPYTAAGGGFLNGGRPGTQWLLLADPISIWHLLGGV